MPQKCEIDPVVLEQQWVSGIPVVKLAKMYNCHVSQLYKIKQKHKLQVTLKNTNAEPPPPSKLDARLSEESLMPSPWVLARIAELKGIR